jgi:hypothetical protein
MNTLAISAIAFVCVFGGALVGFRLRSVLPEEHLNTLSRDVVKLAMGTIATMTALVLGLLVNSAKNSFDTQCRELTEMSAKIILLDRALSHYGPEAKDAREILRTAVASLIEQTWPSKGSGRAMSLPTAEHSEILFDKIQELAPANDTQRMLQNRALTLAIDIGQMRWLLVEQGYSPVSTPFGHCGGFLAHDHVHELWNSCSTQWHSHCHCFSRRSFRLWRDVPDFGNVHAVRRLDSDIQCFYSRRTRVLRSLAVPSRTGSDGRADTGIGELRI